MFPSHLLIILWKPLKGLICISFSSSCDSNCGLNTVPGQECKVSGKCESCDASTRTTMPYEWSLEKIVNGAATKIDENVLVGMTSTGMPTSNITYL